MIHLRLFKYNYKANILDFAVKNTDFANPAEVKDFVGLMGALQKNKVPNEKASD
jgi:hypothetical protein